MKSTRTPESLQPGDFILIGVPIYRKHEKTGLIISGYYQYGTVLEVEEGRFLVRYPYIRKEFWHSMNTRFKIKTSHPMLRRSETLESS
jgi:hypothetical protein